MADTSKAANQLSIDDCVNEIANLIAEEYADLGGVALPITFNNPSPRTVQNELRVNTFYNSSRCTYIIRLTKDKTGKQKILVNVKIDTIEGALPISENLEVMLDKNENVFRKLRAIPEDTYDVGRYAVSFTPEEFARYKKSQKAIARDENASGKSQFPATTNTADAFTIEGIVAALKLQYGLKFVPQNEQNHEGISYELKVRKKSPKDSNTPETELLIMLNGIGIQYYVIRHNDRHLDVESYGIAYEPKTKGLTGKGLSCFLFANMKAAYLLELMGNCRIMSSEMLACMNPETGMRIESRISGRIYTVKSETRK